MHGTNFSRGLRIVSHFTRNPFDMFRYIKYLPVWGKQPLDYSLPWYSFSSIDFLKKYLRKDMSVFEFGGGGSTLFFAKHVQKVFCTESSNAWAQKISQKLKIGNLLNVEINVLPFDAHDKNRFLESSYLNSIKNKNANVYVIDGFEDKIQLRPECFWRAEKQIKNGDIIVVDDSWQYESIRKNNKANNRIEFKSIGPCRYGVTSTDIFFY